MEQRTNTERDGPVGGLLATAVMQQAVVLEDTAPRSDEPGPAATDDVAEPSSDDVGPTAEDDTEAESPRKRRESDRQLLANVYTDPKRHTVTFLMDDVTANTVMYAVRMLAADSEAHAREVRLAGSTLPPDSYGASNRLFIAMRHERIAACLRTLEGNYYHETTMPSMVSTPQRAGA